MHYNIQEGWTALHSASINGQAKIADLLIQAGANVDVQTKVIGLIDFNYLVIY